MKIAIIGAGYGGMAAAWDLRRKGHEVTIYESADYVGGLASGFKEPGWKWSVEKFYHHWFASDKHMLGLIDELGLSDVTDLLQSPDTHMEAVLRDFGNRTRGEDPVVHFYELFLSEYDKQRKVQRGVFYTPQPVVSYIVRSVHELLQTEFGLEDGLASTVTWGEMIARQPPLPALIFTHRFLMHKGAGPFSG